MVMVSRRVWVPTLLMSSVAERVAEYWASPRDAALLNGLALMEEVLEAGGVVAPEFAVIVIRSK